MQKELISSNSEARIYLLTGKEEQKYILKESDNDFLLRTEAQMLKYLAPFIRVPEVLRLEKGKLYMGYIHGDSGCSGGCEAEIADMLARLHANSSGSYGFDYDTTIGPFRQSNRRHDKWIDFFREERVMDFAEKAYEERRIGRELMKRIERFSADFEGFLREPRQPSLLHGDIWNGNVLTRNNRLAALIDPAIYYGHHEMELAFIGMFHTFGEDFYLRYAEHIPVEEGFFDVRAPIYRLFPYLVHVRAFGSSYLNGLEKIVDRFGY